MRVAVNWSLKARIAAGSSRRMPAVTKPTRSGSRAPPPAARAAETACSNCCTALRASPSSAAPALVSAVPRAERSNSVSPIHASSRLIDWLSGGCSMFRRWAARPKCSSSATAMKWRK